MKVRYLIVSAVLLSLAGSAYAGDESIKSTARLRALRKAKAARFRAAEKIKTEKFVERMAKEAEYDRRRQMENESHAAQMQHAINGHNANMVQAQRNMVEAERNQVIAEHNRALEAARNVQCYRCRQFGHHGYGCSR